MWIEFQTKTSKQLCKEERIIFARYKGSFVASDFIEISVLVFVCVCKVCLTVVVRLHHLNKPGKKTDTFSRADVKSYRPRSGWTQYLLPVQGHFFDCCLSSFSFFFFPLRGNILKLKRAKSSLFARILPGCSLPVDKRTKKTHLTLWLGYSYNRYRKDSQFVSFLLCVFYCIKNQY